jgi:pentatricopeptide repeat-containing protein PET309
MVLKVFAKHGKLENVKSLIDHIFHTNGPPKDCRTLTSLLHVHAQRRELAETRAAFESISAKYGLQPNLACYNILIRAYAREDDAESAMELFNQLGPNASTTSLDLAQRSVRLKPDFYTYGTLMGLFSQRGDTARVDDLYRMVREDGIHITTPMIDCLVLARIRSGRLSDALRIVNEATAEDSNQSLTTMWNYIILGHVFNQDLQGMKDTYDRMQQADIKFNAMTYAAFLQGLVFARRFDHAIRVLWKIMPMAGIQPSAFHHGILMIGLVNANKNAFALFVYEKMIDRRIAPNETTQVQMLKAAANLEMHQADSDDIPNDIPEYSIAQEFLTEGANGRRKPTLSSYPEPQQSKISPGSRLAYLEQLMNRHAALGQGNRVKELQKKWIQEMQRLYPDRHPLLSFNIIWALMRSHVKSDNFEEGDKYWEQLVAHVRKEAAASGIDVQTSGWVQAPQRTRLCVPLSYQMRSLARRNKLEKLVQLIRDLRQDGFTLNNLNTNIYAEILSQSQSPRLIQLAFEACEEHLMSLWSGWKSLKTVAVMTFNKSKLVDKDFRPHYRTMVSLSTALLDLKQLSRDGRDGKGALQHVEENCPRTLQAIQSLPRVEDSTQMGSFLRNSGDA